MDFRKALWSQFNLYASQSFSIRTLLTDGEGAIGSLRSEIEGSGIVVNPTGANQHVEVIERKIRLVKERVSHSRWQPFSWCGWCISASLA